MLLAALVLGALALYFFGVRAALWSAGATILLCIIALVAPRYATAIYAFIAAGAIALWQVGSRRPRPADAVIAVRFIRGALRRAWSTARSLLGSDGGKGE
ncbi:MAG: hypothetical protein LC659_05575 [Myxococcales bacterium]|nr:hypothetical protein [Myxococcales bacterium]